MEERIIKALMCPVCNCENLTILSDKIICEGCKKEYPINENGKPNFMIDKK